MCGVGENAAYMNLEKDNMKCTYDKKEGIYTYSYKGDLKKEVDKSFIELKKKEEALVLLKAIYDKAKKEKESVEKRIRDLRGFLETVKDKKGIVPSVEGEENEN